MNYLPLLKALFRNMRLSFGGEIQTPKFSTTTGANTPASGNVIYCIKPLGANVTITSAKDINGTAISALAGVEIQRGDEYKDYFTEITFSSTTVVRLYEKIKDDLVAV